MIRWFKKQAPICVKFKALLAVQALWGVLGLAGAAMAAQGSIAVGIAAAAVALAGSVLTIAIAGRLICLPYVETVERVEAMAAGDVDSPINHQDHVDCVGRLIVAMTMLNEQARTFQQSAESQKHIVEALGDGLARLADGKLYFRLTEEFPPEYKKLQHDFNRTMDSLSETLGSVTRSSQSIHAGASEIRVATQDLSQRTEEQAASLEESANAMNEITDMVKGTAASAAQVTAAIGDAHREASEGGRVVEHAVDAMGAIEKSAQEITQIINVIDGIAFQTNLLALNAGVEAARAGDAGKGFAVVANEVRALAQRSAEAAKDIKALIMTSGQQVEEGVTLVGETGSMLTRIVSRVGEISALISSISESTETQATGVQQVNSAVGEMDKMTQQNAAMVEQSTAAARSLANEADELAKLVTGFTFQSGSSAGSRPTEVKSLGKVEAVAARPAGAVSGNLALNMDEDDWSEF